MPLYLRVLRGAWAYHAVVVLVFATTLAVYPAVTVLVEPSSQGTMQGLYGFQWRVELRILQQRLIGPFDSFHLQSPPRGTTCTSSRFAASCSSTSATTLGNR